MTYRVLPHPEAEKLGPLIAQGRQDNPGLRARDLAQSLGLSEGLMLSARCSEDVVRLQSATKAMLKAFIDLGEVMVLTRNESCVHEKVGHWGRIGGGDHVALVLNGAIDLRIFLKHWLHVFAVSEDTPKGIKRSIQIFNAEGDAVHKIFLREASDVATFEALVERFRHENQSPFFLPGETEAFEQERVREDGEVNVKALRADWLAMGDVHEFFGMLNKHKVDRMQAHRLVGPDLAKPLDVGAVKAVINAAAETQLPIMVFVGSPGCVQIHAGPVETLKTVGPWFNILDPGFNLHLREDHISKVWLVRKPNAFGHVTSIEVYDASDKLIVQLYGVRNEKADENPDWRALAESLPALTGLEEVVS
ncbi:putative hemin transport protein [Cohaesibacter sp. ES.047]|uniref:hemin-degrading factor n=1 Tax=Cohaesibacter sp. ES.047 TaxID=1798205 RepID=UPI000BB82525|nr:ChuX/HutX family heme-like substrate-binding protein [Cohaesibacter sp. ES.047]SNY91274.1 putative hemin transport protein [Cohaesibacter sp. ES.047]